MANWSEYENIMKTKQIISPNLSTSLSVLPKRSDSNDEQNKMHSKIFNKYY